MHQLFQIMSVESPSKGGAGSVVCYSKEDIAHWKRELSQILAVHGEKKFLIKQRCLSFLDHSSRGHRDLIKDATALDCKC